MQIKFRHDVVKDIEKTIVDKEKELKKEKISYEMSFKKMKDELDIFKEKPRRIEKRIIAMYIKATSKLNTAEGTLTTRRKMLEELI